MTREAGFHHEDERGLVPVDRHEIKDVDQHKLLRLPEDGVRSDELSHRGDVEMLLKIVDCCTRDICFVFSAP